MLISDIFLNFQKFFEVFPDFPVPLIHLQAFSLK